MDRRIRRCGLRTSSSGSSGGVGGGVRFPININTASPSELDALPGIGPSLANAIITYRNENGPFASPHDSGSPRHRRENLREMADLIVNHVTVEQICSLLATERR